MTKPVLSVVVPVYNEEEVILETHRRLKSVLEALKIDFEVIYVNDGSRDLTLAHLRALCRGDNRFKALDFSRNFGHQIAITAGMRHSSGAAVVVIDADLQDPPEVIREMLDKWHEGYEVVYGRRIRRNGETKFKKITASFFYRFLNWMTDIELPVDTGDFRLIDRKVCDALCAMPEHNRYVRGLVAWMGFRQTAVDFVREARFAGETKYPLSKMLKLAGDAVYSFSYKPLAIAFPAGCAAILLSLICIVYGLFVHFGSAPLLIGLVLLFLGLTLFSLAAVGGYISRMYEEIKSRPLYLIREHIGFSGGSNDR